MAIAAAHGGLGLLLLQNSVIRRSTAPVPLTVTIVQNQRSAPLAVLPLPAMVHPTVARTPLPEINVPDDDAPVVMAASSTSSTPVIASAAPADARRSPESPPPTLSEIAYLREPAPHYPAGSRHAREEGLVVLQVTIDESGRVKDIAVYRSSGHRRLDEAARDAVASALFKPYVAGGIARCAIAMIPIEFALHGAPS